MTPAHIDLSDITKLLDQTEPFNDVDGIMHSQMLDAGQDGNLTNVHFMPHVQQYAGRFFLAGKLRYFAYVKPKRLGDLARFMDVVYSQLRCFRQRKKHGDLTDAQLNFSVQQVEADINYFVNERADVWDIIARIRKAVSVGMKDRPESSVKESNKTNMEKYQSMIYESRVMMMGQFDEQEKKLGRLSHSIERLGKQEMQFANALLEISGKLDKLTSLLTADKQPAQVEDPNQTLIPVQQFNGGEFKPVTHGADGVNVYNPPTC